MDGMSMHISDLPDFRLWLQNYFKNRHGQGTLPEDTVLSIDTIYEIGLAIHNGKNEAAQHLLDGIQAKRFLVQCLLWYGAMNNLTLVRFIVEKLKRSKCELLLDFHTERGENALHLAVKYDQSAVVEYLLAEWSQTQVAIISTKAESSRVLSDSSLHFDSAKYFEKLGKVAPAHISKVESHDKMVWYFLTRTMYRWVIKEDREDIWDEEKDKPGRKISRHILEALQQVYTDTAFQSACLRVQDVKYLGPLWEIYGHDPILFMRMADWAASVNANYFFSTHFLELRRQNYNPKFKAMLEGWLDSHHQKFASTAAFLKILQRDWNCMRECWLLYDLRDDPFNHWGLGWKFVECRDGILPFHQGLRLVFDQLVAYTVQKEAEAAVKMMMGFSVQPEVSDIPLESTNEEILEGPTKPFTCYHLLAAAGSGKTHHLMDVLSINFGFYLSSGAINDVRSKSGEALYSARTMGASIDTQHLFRTTRSPWLRSKGEWTASECLGNRCGLLLDSRLDLFYHVVELYKRSDVVLTPQNWLRYQLSCRHERDSFAMIFVFLMIRGVFGRGLRPTIDDTNLLWCFDEVQDDLAEMADNFMGDSTNILENLIDAVRFRDSNTAVLSGTALNFDKVKAVVDKSDKSWRNPSVNRLVQCFALITEDSTFSKVFQSRTAELLGILYGSSSREDFLRKTYSGNKVFIPANERAFNDSYLFRKFRNYCDNFHGGEPPPTEDITEKLREYTVKIVQNSLSFRGRYRWSVYYVEKLLEQYFMDGAMTEQAIDDVAEEAKRILKAPIKRRLHNLARRPKQTRILKDVYNMAFDADLLGRSRILSSEGSAELIERALGYVETSEREGVEAVKVSLVERLVVDSVMEYLEETQQLHPLIIDYLYATQFHEGAFGDAAEVGLADSVNRWSSQELPQRRELLSVFDSIYKISGAGCRFNVNLDLETFFLEKGEGVRRDYFHALPEGYRPIEGEDLGLKQWLYLVCNEKSRPTFLFPEHVAGPDLMFVYRERRGTRRIVFAIQLKTGSTGPASETVMRTMDPDRWLSPEPSLQQEFQDVLKACKDNETISFLSVAFIAGAEINVKTRHEAAIGYMKTRVSILSTWSTDFQEALKEVKSAEGQCKYHYSDAARVRLETARQKLREQEDAFETQQTRKSATEVPTERANPRRHFGRIRACVSSFLTCLISRFWKPWQEIPEPVDEVEKTSTDYYFQILADDSVEKVFGRVFARLLRGVKSKAAFTRKDREYEELRIVLHPVLSTSRDEKEEEGYDISEDDEESPYGNIFN